MILLQLIQRGSDRKASDKFRYQAVFDQVLGFHGTYNFAGTLLVLLALHLRGKTDTTLFRTLTDNLVQAGKGATADKQNIAGIDLKELLLRVFTPTLWGYGSDGALDQFQQGLLDSLTGDVPGYRRIIRLARYLVYFINIDNTRLGLFHIIIAFLQQLLNDVFYILAHVTGFGQRRCIGNGKRYVQQPGKRFGQQGFAAAGRADQ